MTSEEFIKDGDLKLRCRRIVESQDFQTLLRVAYSRMGAFRNNLSFSDKEHVQDRLDGGRQALFAFVKEITTLPYKEIQRIDEEENQFVDPMDVFNSKSTLV